MKKIITLNLLLISLLCSCGNRNKGNEYLLEELNQQVQIKYDQLGDHFRYKVLAYVGDLPKVEEIKEGFNKLKENQDFEVIKSEQMNLQASISADLIIPTKESDLKLLVTLNELLLLNKLMDLAESNISFNALEPVVFKKEESKDEIKYSIVLAAHDEFFSPSIRLFNKNDTVEIFVNDQGFGEFTVKKQSSSQQIIFQGDISFYDRKGQEITLPISYGNK